MRTKTLVLTAALGAAGIATSMAQVYSQNAVGYINLTIGVGFNLIANQLISTPSTVESLMPSPPPGTTVYKFVNGAYRIFRFDPDDLVWTPNGTEPLTPGEGTFVLTSQAFTLTLVGEVPQGNLSTPIPTGFSMISSKVPQSGPVGQDNGTANGTTDLGLTAVPGDALYRFINGNYQIYRLDPDDLVWTPTTPQLNVGESFFFLHSGAPTAWNRSFSVN